MPLPTWIDLVVLIITLRACYVAFERGFVKELLRTAFLVLATALACNFYGIVSEFLSVWWLWSPEALQVVVFASIFFGLLWLGRAAVGMINRLLKTEQLHWLIQSLGVVVGAVRGLWWSGLLLLLLLATGLPYFDTSINERALVGQRLTGLARQSIETVANVLPGHASRGALMPQLHITLPQLPAELAPPSRSGK